MQKISSKAIRELFQIFFTKSTEATSVTITKVFSEHRLRAIYRSLSLVNNVHYLCVFPVSSQINVSNMLTEVPLIQEPDSLFRLSTTNRVSYRYSCPVSKHILPDIESR